MEYLDIKVTKSITHGKCFTIKILRSLRINEPFFFILKRTWDLKIFVHNDGDEFWLAWAPSSLLSSKFQLNIQSNKEAVMTELKVAERQLELYPKKERPCKDPNDRDHRESVLSDEADYRYIVGF
jgi:hypothetical protein